jgi:hypothetical protein
MDPEVLGGPSRIEPLILCIAARRRQAHRHAIRNAVLQASRP